MAASAVLANAALLREITRFQRGLPRDIAKLVWSLTEKPLQMLPRHAVRSSSTSSKFEFENLLPEAVRVGDVAIAKWIDTLPGRLRTATSFDLWISAIRCTSVEMLEYITNRFPQMKSQLKCRLVEFAIERDAVEVLKWLGTNVPDMQYPHNDLSIAVSAGAINVVKLFHERDPPQSWTEGVIDYAARLGKLDLVQFVHEHRSEGCTSAAMDGAAANGHLDVVQFLHAHRSEGCTATAMDAAAANDYLNVVQFLHENRTEGCTTAAVDQAAAKNNMEVVEFLHSYRTEGCTTAAMDNAAMNGHLAMVQFLHTYRNEGCTTAAMDSAAANGHLAVVEFLHNHRTEGCTTAALDAAASKNYVDVVHFLLTHRTEGYTARALLGADGQVIEMLFHHKLQHLSGDVPAEQLAMDAFMRARALLWKYEKQPHLAIETAAKRGDLAVVQTLHVFFHEHHCTLATCLEAADRGQADVVAFLVGHCVTTNDIGRVLRGAINSGDLATTQAVAERCQRDDLVEALTLATRRGLEDIAEYLTTVIPIKRARGA